MRRKEGVLLPIELDILEAGLELLRSGDPDFHGFGIAKRIQSREGARNLTSHGTLYKALGRLAESGMLESRWEDPNAAAEEQRPRRRLYRVSGLGERAYHKAMLEQPGKAPILRLDPS